MAGAVVGRRKSVIELVGGAWVGADGNALMTKGGAECS